MSGNNKIISLFTGDFQFVNSKSNAPLSGDRISAGLVTNGTPYGLKCGVSAKTAAYLVRAKFEIAAYRLKNSRILRGYAAYLEHC